VTGDRTDAPTVSTVSTVDTVVRTVTVGSAVLTASVNTANNGRKTP